MKIEDYFVIAFFLLLIYFITLKYFGDKKRRAKKWAKIPGDDTAVMAPDTKGEMVKVKLPEGVKPDTVKAVYVGKKPENVKIEVEHEKTNRHDSNGPTDHDMSI